MPQITVPQIRSTAYTMLAIFLLAPLFTAWQLQMMDEFHVTTWTGFMDYLKHASLSSFWMAIGWLFLRSPFAGKITEIMSAAHSIAPDGTQTNKSTKLTITEPVPVEPIPAQTAPVQDKPVQAKPPQATPPQSKPRPIPAGK